MKATRFEFEHPVLLHLLLVGLCSLTYLHDRVDFVWLIVQHHSNSAFWERLVFGCGTLMLLASAMVETWAGAQNQVAPVSAGAKGRVDSRYSDHWRLIQLSRILLVLAVGLLLPLPGTILLLTGETILIMRLILRTHDNDAYPLIPSSRTGTYWRSGFRIAASKWGLTLSMIAFVWTLQDRIAEIGAVCSIVLWLLLNLPTRGR